jgi:organic hydroperoxide reductase OsmC/OhrA
MHMRYQHERRFRVDMTHEEGYRFVSCASEDGRPHGTPFRTDEPDPVGDATGPATPALLGAAIGHCLSASMLETLRHAHLDVTSFRTEVVSVVKPNDEGLPRIDHVDVLIVPTLREPSRRTARCADVFERHCTVTASVREGIDVRVRVEWDVEDASPASASDGVDAAVST